MDPISRRQPRYIKGMKAVLNNSPAGDIRPGESSAIPGASSAAAANAAADSAAFPNDLVVVPQ